MLFKRKEVQRPALEKILAERRARNVRTWGQFQAQGLTEAWEFVFGEGCKCPPLELEPTVFRERLGMRTTKHELITDLELAVRRKLDGVEGATQWRGQ